MDNKPSIPDAPAALLRFYTEAGVDCALNETPRNRLLEAQTLTEHARQSPAALRTSSSGASAPTTAHAPAPSAGSPVTGPADDPTRIEPKLAAALAEAELLASQAATLEDLTAILAQYQGCPLSQTAKNMVFGAGPSLARVMIIGEAPGAEEDRTGEVFAGSSGLLLDRMLHAIGLSRSMIRIGLSIFWRPPGNRIPSDAEKALCAPFLRRHIALTNPDLLLLMGSLPAHLLLGETQSLLKMRGHWFDYALPTRTIPTLVSLPPTHLLRQPTHKAHAWRDLKSLKQALLNLPAHS